MILTTLYLADVKKHRHNYPILEIEHHLCIAEDFKWGDERFFFFIVNGKADLMIARIGI
jgi:hypothetical protein